MEDRLNGVPGRDYDDKSVVFDRGDNFRCEKNDVFTVKIEDIGNDGEGIGKVNGYTLFVKDAVIGDRVRCKIMKAKKHYAYGKLEEILVPSPVVQVSQAVRRLPDTGNGLSSPA